MKSGEEKPSGVTDPVFNSGINTYHERNFCSDITDDSNVILKENSSRNEVNGNSECSSKMSGILDEVTKLYTEKLQRVNDGEAEEELLKRKVSVLECWVNDLGEQNSVLVSTVEELEKEASRRVSLLQEKLDKMAVVTRESCVSLRDHQIQVTSLLKQKLSAEDDVKCVEEKVLSLESANSSLLRENSNLRQDLDNVLEVMTRGRMTGKWDYSDLSFNSIRPDQIFGSGQPSSLRSLSPQNRENFTDFHDKKFPEIRKNSLTSNLSFDGEDISVPKLKFEIQNMKRIHTETTAILTQRDQHIADLQSQLTELHHKLAAAQTQADNTTSTLHNLMDRGRHDSLEISRRDDVIRQLLSPTRHFKDDTAKSIDQVDVKSKLEVELELSDNIDVLAMRLADLEEECQQLRHQNATLKSSHAHCTPAIDQLRDELTDSQNTVQEVKSQLKDTKHCQQQLEQKLEQKEGLIRTLEEEKHPKKNFSMDERKHLKCNNTFLTDYTTKQTQTEFQQQQHSVFDTFEFSDSKSSKVTPFSESLKISKLENELSEKNILIRELQNHLVLSREELRLKDETLYNIEQKLDSSRRSYDEKEERMLYLTSQLTNLQLEVSRLHGNVQQLRLQLDNKSELVLKLECENRSLVRQLNEKSSIYEGIQKEFSHLLGDIERKKKEIAEQKMTIGTLQEALISTKVTCDKLRTQFESESGSNLASNKSLPTFLHRNRMDSLSLKSDSCKDSASHLSTVLPDLRSLNMNTPPLSRNCPDVVSFLSRKNGELISESHLQSKIPNVTASEGHEITLKPLTLNLNVPQSPDDFLLSLNEDDVKSKSLILTPSESLNSLDHAPHTDSKSLTVLSPTDSGIGAEDFATNCSRSYTKSNGKKNGTFGKIFEV